MQRFCVRLGLLGTLLFATYAASVFRFPDVAQIDARRAAAQEAIVSPTPPQTPPAEPAADATGTPVPTPTDVPSPTPASSTASASPDAAETPPGLPPRR
jgi:hypothetical protein